MADLDNIAQAPDSAINALTSSHLFLGRALQLLFIAVVSLLPALMYFVFDRERLGTLRARFVQQVFRLDPSLQRRTDLDSKFGEQIDEAYGPPRTGRGRLLGGRLSPIIVATVLITVGWTLTLLNTDVVPNAAGEFSVFDLFRPDTTMLAFAFLGAYFFAIQLVLRSYLRGDLRPKSYGNITVRIIIVVILGWVLQALAGESDPAWLLGAVFIAGIVPETALRWIREYVRGKGPDWAKLDDEKITEADPLTRLEGIDIYDLTRLTEEGVTNVEGLAHHELVDLMLKTRIPAPRLVDWVDQAILYLHVHGKEEGEGIPPDPLPTQLRSFGIRTATDLQNACNARPPDERDKFLGILGGDGARPYRVQVILDALADDEWLAQIKHWRKPLDPDDIIEIDAQHDTSPPRVGVTVLGPGVESGQADSTVVVGEAPAETVAAGNGSSGEIGTAGVEAG